MIGLQTNGEANVTIAGPIISTGLACTLAQVGSVPL
eukprot:COSAG06_NODE_51073_length_314_cov_1.162791_1_plen_35_part_10